MKTGISKTVYWWSKVKKNSEYKFLVVIVDENVSGGRSFASLDSERKKNKQKTNTKTLNDFF